MQDAGKLAERFSSSAQVLDGGLATELESRGHDITGRLWSGHVLLNDPQAIEALHYDYLKAGADIVISASYQVSLPGMVEAGYSQAQGIRALELSVELAVNARNRYLAENPANNELPLVAASVGPYGAYLANGSEYTGDYGVDSNVLREFHRERLEVLLGTEADLLACETIPSLAEAKVLAGLIAEYGQPPAWISFSCRDGEHICDGTPIADVARAVTGINPGILATGVNCTAPGHVEDAVKSFANATSLPVIAYPNSGEGWNAAKRRWEGENDPRDFCEYASRWQDAGATLIGGCCRTGPGHIAGLCELLH